MKGGGGGRGGPGLWGADGGGGPGGGVGGEGCWGGWGGGGFGGLWGLVGFWADPPRRAKGERGGSGSGDEAAWGSEKPPDEQGDRRGEEVGGGVVAARAEGLGAFDYRVRLREGSGGGTGEEEGQGAGFRDQRKPDAFDWKEA